MFFARSFSNRHGFSADSAVVARSLVICYSIRATQPIDTVKPYSDDRPLLVPGTAETREYRLRWWDNGDWNPVQKLTVGA